MKSRDRVLVAARAICFNRGVSGMDLAHDLAHEVAVMQMNGVVVRLDYTGINWVLGHILDRWTGSASDETRRKFGRNMREPTSPIAFVQLREVWNMATAAQREAVFTLLEYGPIKWGFGQAKMRRNSNALRALRERLGVRPVQITRRDRWKRRAA